MRKHVAVRYSLYTRETRPRARDADGRGLRLGTVKVVFTTRRRGARGFARGAARRSRGTRNGNIVRSTRTKMRSFYSVPVCYSEYS